MVRKLFAILIFLTLTACLANPGMPDAETTVEPTATVETLVPLCDSPCEPRKDEKPLVAATAEPTAQPTATCEPKCSGWTMVQETKFGQEPNNPLLNNMDVGDANMTAVVMAWDATDPTIAFISIIDRMYNLDFEREKISGTYWYFTGDPEAVYCWANEMASEMDGKVYKLYVGSHEAPAGWSKVFPSAWTMKTWVFTDTPIDVPNAAWNKQTVQVGDKSHTYGSGNWTYGQLWDGMDSGTVYHFMVVPGWEISSPKYQGTIWSVSNVTFETVDLLIMRFSQMSSEVLLRDDGPTVNMYYCGSAYLQPNGWNTVPDGWTCTKKT